MSSPKESRFDRISRELGMRLSANQPQSSAATPGSTPQVPKQDSRFNGTLRERPTGVDQL